MVQQYIGRTRRIDAEPSAYNAATREVGQNNITLKVLLQILGYGHGKEADKFVNLAFCQTVKLFEKMGELHSIAHSK